MEKVRGEELIHLSGIKDIQKEKRGVEDYEWYDCPLTVKTDENVEKVRATVRTDCHLYINTITE